MGKYSSKADLMAENISAVFNRAMRLSLRAGIAAAVNATVHDSSNAAYHWMVAAVGKSRPASRTLGNLRDLRYTKGVIGEARPKQGTVGLNGAGGRNKNATINAVRTRETVEVINRVIAGRNPPGRFYLYNALYERRSVEYTEKELKAYAINTRIDKAGEAGVKAISEAFDRYLKNGMMRKR